MMVMMMDKWKFTVHVYSCCLLFLCFVSLSYQQMLNIHVVAHSHDDVGWLKTVDEYYYGANQSIQVAGVQYTIDTVVLELMSNPARKFIYVEMAYFFRWWREQNTAMQANVKQLVANGQLEFINGGWTMHDEACVHFEDMVSQMTLGHQFLMSTFGVTPKVAWQSRGWRRGRGKGEGMERRGRGGVEVVEREGKNTIKSLSSDPFGHSATSAMLDVAIGFEGLFYARMDYQDLANREASKSLEMNWYPSKSNPDAEILTGMMYGGYQLTGFLFERGDTPVMNDPDLENYNIGQIADALVGHSMLQNSYLRHNNVMLPWGGDFQYMNAHINYKNIDKLIAYINGNSSYYNATIFYSTPSMYAEAIKKANPTLPNKYGDFMPYADCPHCYWSGYFTSRPTFKGFVRYSSNLLSAVSSLLATSQIQNNAMMEQLFMVQQPNAVATHHDSVTGTEKQHVTYDYELNLAKGNEYAFDLMNQILGQLSGNKSPPQFTYCPLLNESICPPSTEWSSGVLVVSLYNPLGWERDQYVRIPVNTPKIQVMDKDGALVIAQVSPGPDGLFNLTFTATVPALGYNTSGNPAEYVAPVNISGNIESVYDKGTAQTIGIQQEYLYYVGNTGDASAYPFPTNTYTMLYNGSVVSELVRTFSPSLSQIVRLYADAQYLEVVDVVGPIDISDNKGKEVITRYTTSLNNNGTWYSDSNGVEMLKRIVNFRPDWPFDVTEPVAGNYVPIDAITFINDTSANLAFTILPDRSRSSASLINGEIETMLHRRLLVDDHRGVGEPLNESTIMQSTELLIFSNASSAASLYRPLAKAHYHPCVIGFSQTDSVNQWVAANQPYWAPMNSLPVNVQLLSFVPLPSNEYILRLHHIFQQGEDEVLSQPVTVDIAAIFPGLTLTTAQETQLTAVQLLSSSSRPDLLRYPSTPSDDNNNNNNDDVSLPVVLQPAEIRTFVVKFNPTASGKVVIV